jgi:mannose-6-phosphate isomerase-like protein (cupin superfamily)
METKINLAEKLALLEGPYQPGIVGMLNDYKLVVVKTHGEFVWHKHDDTDDFFLVLSGHLTIQLRDRDVELGPGELFVVPRGVEHCPKGEHAEVLLIEPAGTPNTGDAGGERTAPERRI